MSTLFEPSLIDRAWRRTSNFPLIGDILDIALFKTAEKGNGAAFEKWLWRATPRIESRKAHLIINHLLIIVMKEMEDPDIRNRSAAHLMQICTPEQDLGKRESILISLASKKEWNLLFTFGKTHHISAQEATIAFTIFSAELNTPDDQARARGWFERFGGNPGVETGFYHREEFTKEQEDLVVSILEYTMRYGDSTLVESVLDRLIHVDEYIPSERFSGMLTREPNNPLSLKNIEQLEMLGIAWGDVSKAFVPDDTPVQRATFLFNQYPYLVKLIPVARASLEAAEDAEILDDQTIDIARPGNAHGAIPVPKPRRI